MGDSRAFRLRTMVAFLALALPAPSCTAAAPSHPSQSDVEAVYLFDFGKFVRWPTGAEQGAMRICIAGTESFKAGVEKIVANENINGRSLEVRRVLGPGEASGCAILFIDAAEGERAPELLAAVAGKPTLTVSDLTDFLTRGGMIQFELVGDRVRFSVNLGAVNRGHLAMSSELLKVALTVKGKAGDGGAR
jgi:hypothetical protein